MDGGLLELEGVSKPEYFSIFTQQKSMGDGFDSQCSVEASAAVRCNGIFDGLLFTELCDRSLLFVRDCKNCEAFAAEMVMKFVQVRNRFATGATPSGPEFDKQYLPIGVQWVAMVRDIQWWEWFPPPVFWCCRGREGDEGGNTNEAQK